MTVLSSSGPLLIGINRNIIGKPAPGVPINYATDWEAVSLSRPEMIETVCNGHAFSAQYSNGYRKTDNFLRTNVIAADIDFAWTIEQAMSLPFVRNYGSFLYTTPSHSDDHHRFRLVFETEKPFELASEWANSLFGLALTLNADKAIRDGARMFYGNADAHMIDIGNKLPDAQVRILIDMALDERKRVAKGKFGSAPIQSSITVDGSDFVRMSDGRLAQLQELRPQTTIHCPYHADLRPSAFVVHSGVGAPGIHCRTCARTFWSKKPNPYEFDAFDRLLETRTDLDKIRAEERESSDRPFDRFFPARPSFKIFLQQHLPAIHYRPGITLVKSPKGSGKTEAIAALIRQIKAGQLSGIEPSDRPKSVLVIGHRQSLLRQCATRLNIDCYLDDEKSRTHRRSRFGYAISLDSLHKLTGQGLSGANANSGPPRKYDVVILDESEQVFSHLLADTLKKGVGMTEAFRNLAFALRHAKAVVALDADLGLITGQALATLRPDDWQDRCHVILNRPIEPTERRTIQIYESKKALQDRMVDAVKAGKRCFVACNSKKAVEIFEELIRRECGQNVKMLALTSANSRSKVADSFLADVAGAFDKLQVLICSPTLGTGVDISFPGGKQGIDEVFGFFAPYVNSHTDIDQQLSRVRNPGAVSVYFEQGKSSFETHIEAIKSELALSGSVPNALCDYYDDDGNLSYNPSHPLLNIAAHVMVARRASTNELRPLFIRLRESNGWDVEIVGKKKAEPNIPYKEAKAARAAQRTAKIVAAADITQDDYDELERGGKSTPLSEADQFAMIKFELRKAYGVEVDEDLVDMDREGRLRVQLTNYRAIFDGTSVRRAVADLIRCVVEENAVPASSNPAHALATILMSSGLIENDELQTDKRLRVDHMEAFVALCSANRVLLEEALKQGMRDDFRINPIRQLNRFLQHMGLKLVKAGKTGNAKKKSLTYQLDGVGVEMMAKLSLGPAVVEGE